MLNSRLAKYRDQALARARAPHESPRESNLTKAFFEIYEHLPLAERQARAHAYTIENEPVHIFPLERIAGQVYQACPGSGAPEYFATEPGSKWAEVSAVNMAHQAIGKVFPASDPFHKHFGGTGAPGHITWDYGIVLNLGVEGMLSKIAGLRQNKINDPEAVEFYDCTVILLNGFLAWVEKHVGALKKATAEESDPQRRKELLEMAETCEHAPAKPARTFHEAVQSFFFQQMAVLIEGPHAGNGPGRLDWYLWPFLKADLDAGRATLEEARELLTELMIKLDERLHDTDLWVEAITVGGRDPGGSISINPLSYMITEIMIDLKNTHPSVYIRVPDGAPSEFIDLAVKYLIESGNRGQVYGDDAVISAMIDNGIAPADARHWGAGGCMEIGVQGASGDMLFSFAQNVARTFELCLNAGKTFGAGEKIAPIDKSLADYTSFDELYNTFSAELARETDILMRQLDIALGFYSKCRPLYLLSTMVHDCLERGRELNGGGARYPDFGGSGVGIPNVGDSLYAIKKAVFEEKRYTGAQILEGLKRNFDGFEEMRAYLLNLPKFGSGRDEEVVKLVDRVLMDYSANLKNHTNPQGGHCRPIILGFVWVVDFGLQTGATPDGRLAGKPLAHGLAPQCGSATNGITAAIGDATSLSLQEIDGGASMMWDIDSVWAKPEFVRPVLQTYLNEGGHLFQGNVTSVEDLIKAQKNPDEHRDLMVRVGGYSARFLTLSKETQDEIINRRKYGISE